MPEAPLLEQRPLVAIQLTFENVEDPTEVVVAPVNGVKPPKKEWTYKLELEPGKTLIGMRQYSGSGSLVVKTSAGEVHFAFSLFKWYPRM